MPVEVSATRTADGKLEIALRSESARNLDLRVSVQAPDLFPGGVQPVGIADLAPQETRKVTFEPAKGSAAGTEVPVTVGLEIGGHGIRASTSTHKVRF
jgi:hypothetical protein